MMKEANRNPLQFAAMLLITQLFLLLLQLKSTESGKLPPPGCPDKCGDVLIPYPFGIGDNCSFSLEFMVVCITTFDHVEYPFFDIKNNGTPTPYRIPFQIVDINISLGQVRFTRPIAYMCYNTSTKKDDPVFAGMGLLSNTLWVNKEKNKLVVIGCNTFGYVTLENYFTSYSAGCLATCDSKDSLNEYGPSCSGIGCCQSSIPKSSTFYGLDFDQNYNHSLVHNFSPCSYAMLVDNSAGSYVFNTTSITNDELRGQFMPVLYDWVIGNTACDIATNQSSYACKSNNSVCSNSSTGQGYICNCSRGYEGNPYLLEGCQDIDECATHNPCSARAKCHNLPGGYRCSCSFGWRNRHNDTTDTQNICEPNLALLIGGCAGILALSFLGFAMFIVLLERRKYSKEKKKYFQQHGGLILMDRIKSNQGFSFTIFTMQQVEGATNNFDSANIIGHGGQGTVYQGTLNDQSAAIKRCKIIDESKKKEFGKEMIILSQINHKNIVKLLGCCLEAEVPMLVYEFIPNGTLFHHIHCESQGSNFSLSKRLKIAHESAEALAYLHTSASPPIIHGDVKSLNILLDQNYMAKVSDFGASVLAPIDKVQFVTLVQGTCGYLDPEYMQSCQLTDKSDVYSFGVVLLELLTSKPVIDFAAPEDERSLSSRFLTAIEDKKTHELLDDQIICEADMEAVMKVAQLAKECLSMKGDERPTMKEVADELYRIEKIRQHTSKREYNPVETELFVGEASHHIEIKYTDSFSQEKKAEKRLLLVDAPSTIT